MRNIKLQRIDKSLVAHHSCLESNDICLFFGEYAIKKGYQHSPMNQLIFNLKKEVTRKNRNDWVYKEQAIQEAADLLKNTPDWERLKICTWVPFPPSKTQEHQEYDDRLSKILYSIKKWEKGLDVRHLLTAKSDRQASHLSGKRFLEEEHINNLTVDKNLISPIPEKAIIIFDDVITTGASFKAAKRILQDKFPTLPICGIFIARAVNQ